MRIASIFVEIANNCLAIRLSTDHLLSVMTMMSSLPDDRLIGFMSPGYETSEAVSPLQSSQTIIRCHQLDQGRCAVNRDRFQRPMKYVFLKLCRVNLESGPVLSRRKQRRA